MTARVRNASGLGFPPSVYTQNSNESINSVLKRESGGKKLTLKQAALAIQACVQEQQSQVRLALFGAGEYKVADEYINYSVPQDQFYGMSVEQRKKAFSTFNTARVTRLPTVIDDVNKLASDIPNSDMLCKLSVQPNESNILTVPFTVVKQMFQDASSLLYTGKNIVNAPGLNAKSTFFVTNDADQCQPMMVALKGSRFQCQGKCQKFAAFKICAHTISVAEKLGELGNMLANFNRENRFSITRLASNDRPKDAGKKATKATQRRKGAANKPTSVITGYQQRQHETIPAPSAIQTQSVPKAPQSVATPTCQKKTRKVGVTTPDPLPGTYVITLLRLCHDKTSKCYGCSGSFHGKDGSYLTPPNDVVIVGKSRRKFYDQQGNQKEGKLGNVYFHFNADCVRIKNSFFVPFLCRLQEGVLDYLLPIHRQLLTHAGISV